MEIIIKVYEQKINLHSPGIFNINAWIWVYDVCVCVHHVICGQCVECECVLERIKELKNFFIIFKEIIFVIYIFLPLSF